MFEVKSYISIPDKKATDLNQLNENPSDFFIEINNEVEIFKLANKLDLNYLNGAIYLKYGEQVLMDFTLWDLVDQLWAYFLNIIDDILENGKGGTYFPDQPIRLEMTSVSQEIVLFCIDEGKKIKSVLPKHDFFDAILDGAEYFYKSMSSYFREKCDYSYELEKIKQLRTTMSRLK